MSKKPSSRPSIIDDLDLSADVDTPAAAPTAANVVSLPQQPAAPPKIRPDIVKTTVYLPPAVHQKLREIAFTKDCKIHDLLMDGINSVLIQHGHPGVEQLKKV